MAVDYIEREQRHKANECDEKALMITEKINGDDHPDVARSYYSLGFDYRELGQHHEAKECDEKALMIRKKISKR